MLCDELGIATGVQLEALVEAGRLAEEIVGRRLPSTLLRSGTLLNRERLGNPLIVLVFALPLPPAAGDGLSVGSGEVALPPQALRLRAAFILSLIQLVLLLAIAGWVFSRS